MSKPKSQVTLSEAILEEACGWFIDFNEGELDAGGRQQFNQWLRRSPEHVRAYVEIAAAWEDSSRIGNPQTLAPDVLIAQTLVEQNVVPLNARAQPLETSSHASSARREGEATLLRAREEASRAKGRRFKFAVAASILLAIPVAWLYSQRDTYSAATGEQRSITLTDGSTVELNSRSRLRLRFSETERTVDLLEGQALFQVKKDSARPFIVDSNGTRVRAVGTQFDVYRKSSGTTVTVLEGRVAVLTPTPATQHEPSSASGTFSSNVEKEQGTDASLGSAHAPNGLAERQRPSSALSGLPERGGIVSTMRGEVLLSAGEQLTVTPRIAPRPVRVNVANATAWTQRKLIFDETPLMEAIAEFNRYNTRQIVIEDAALADFHIRGNFQATDPDRLILFLRDRFGVHVSEQGGEIRISRD